MELADGRPWGGARVVGALRSGCSSPSRLFAPGRVVVAIALFKKGDVCRGQQPAHRCLSAPDARLGFAYLRLLADFSAHPNAQYPAPSRAHLPLSTCLCAAVCIGPSVRLRVARRAPPSFTELGWSISVCSVPRGGRGVCATAGKRRWVRGNRIRGRASPIFLCMPNGGRGGDDAPGGLQGPTCVIQCPRLTGRAKG